MIQQRGTRWRVVVHAGLDPVTGKPQQLAGTAKTEREAEATEARLPEIVGGLSLALARTFTIVEGKLKSPSSGHWERAFRIFDLLL